MSKLEIIDQALLLQAAQAGAAAHRRRKNYNFHGAEGDACHRLLNAVEPDSYIAPHRHLEPAKDETMLALKGRFGVVLFAEDGAVTDRVVLEPGGDALGVNIPHGRYHALVSLEPGSVFFESKAGPYRPLIPEELAPWAPAEGTPEAAGYLAELKKLFEK